MWWQEKDCTEKYLVRGLNICLLHVPGYYLCTFSLSLLRFAVFFVAGEVLLCGLPVPEMAKSKCSGALNLGIIIQ